MTNDELIALLKGPSSVKDEFTAIHIQARDARLAAQRIAEMAEQVKRADEIIFGAGVNLWDCAELSEHDENGNPTILLWHPSGVPFLVLKVESHAPKVDAGHIAFAMADLLDVFMARQRARALRGATEGAAG